MKSPIGFVYLKGFTAVHVAMRHSYLKFTAAQLRSLHALDSKVFIRKDDYGATALHHYLKHTLKPDAELIRTINELSINELSMVPDGIGIFAEENKYYRGLRPTPETRSIPTHTHASFLARAYSHTGHGFIRQLAYLRASVA